MIMKFRRGKSKRSLPQLQANGLTMRESSMSLVLEHKFLLLVVKKHTRPVCAREQLSRLRFVATLSF